MRILIMLMFAACGPQVTLEPSDKIELTVQGYIVEARTKTGAPVRAVVSCGPKGGLPHNFSGTYMPGEYSSFDLREIAQAREYVCRVGDFQPR